MTYKHLFFDLDHTIWDFDKNAEETLYELFYVYSLNDLGLESPEIFIQTYTRNNHALWADYHTGVISKEHLRQTRFRKTFVELGVHPDRVPIHFEEDYVRICPGKTNLFPGAIETLDYLHGKYDLHLISNGFKESTEMKLRNTGLEPYFKTVVISEVIGINKPDKAIFEYALSAANAEKADSIMIGDSLEADVKGALDFGIDAIFFNPRGIEDNSAGCKQITRLNELTELL